MAEQKCPNCGGPLSVGLEEPIDRGDGSGFASSRFDCAACGWSSVQDLPGTEGGDNGGG